ncbi:MAG: hypothetical protein RBT62_10020 [Spirochaetia bacterium]|jgi:hypothetical protein|nr:hypothetical protein [Spirochaetia bacterium]
MKKLFLILACLLLSAAVYAQGSPEPRLDGIVSPGEYSETQILSGIIIGVSLSADGSTLYALVNAKTGGWVAIGLGSLRMNGATMVLGYAEGKQQSISFELGKGYKHTTTTIKDGKAFVAQDGDQTTLEVSVPAAAFVKNGVVQMNAAFGPKDDFKSKHTRRVSIEFTF